MSDEQLKHQNIFTDKQFAQRDFRHFKIQQRGRRHRQPEVKINMRSSLSMTKSKTCRVLARDGRDPNKFDVLGKT